MNGQGKPKSRMTWMVGLGDSTSGTDLPLRVAGAIGESSEPLPVEESSERTG